ncbi:MAG: hypothetical protein ACRDQ5_18045, partial [Sciscionella sp.]
AIVAQSWAKQTGSPRIEAYAADRAACAYAADGQADACRMALDTAQSEVVRIKSDPNPQYQYFYNESVFWGTMSDCALRLGDPDGALDTVSKSLPADTHNYVIRKLFHADAFVQKSEIPEACRAIGEVIALTPTYTSPRADQRVTELRTALTPWQHSKPVRELDDVWAAYRRSPSGSATT